MGKKDGIVILPFEDFCASKTWLISSGETQLSTPHLLVCRRRALAVAPSPSPTLGDFCWAPRTFVYDGLVFQSVFMLELEGHFTVFFASQNEVGPQRKEPVFLLLPSPRVPRHSLFASLDA